MARDIEEFLRRAAERKNQQKQGQAAPPQRAESPPPPQRARPTPRSDFDSFRQPEIIEDIEVLETRPRSVTSKSSKKKQLQSRHLETNLEPVDQPSAAVARRLQSEFAHVEAKFDHMAHEHLDHDNPQASKKARSKSKSGSASSGSASADSLRKLLAEPQTIRQAIIVSEILKRPDFDES